MKARIAFYFTLIAVLSYVFTKLGVSYPYASYKDYLSTLLTASSMVFTIMGIWIAFLYPNALQRLVNPKKIENVDFSESLSETKRLESLVASVLRSAFVVMAIMIIHLAYIIVPSLAIYDIYILEIKSIALAIAIGLCALQFEAIAYVIFSNIMFINDLHQKREDREADGDI